ncbi:DMT family transporter [Mycolicibacterium smegmatis]|uniref:DMT family transporter n=1 Tax=Mycolicibacterium smegmatis TaxID=1772 RepID=UPI001E3F11B5|nr:DMT family transporter [Mycolicibacterium smegmatis]UGU32512.1 DMT family transporter [Mycolicibacterium smegmatis]ULN67404.1 DMT family transporter [Mycolicibacterium smegmatis]
MQVVPGRTTARRTTLLVPVAAGVTVLLWSSAFVVIRAVGEVLSPGPLAFMRLLVGTAVLVAVAAWYRRPVPRGRALALVVGYGVLWFALYTVLLNWAEQHLDAGTAALLVNFAPIIVAVFAGLFLGEGFPRARVAGIAIAFAGVALIAAGGTGGAGNDKLGVALGLVTAVLYAASVLMQKVALRSVDAVTATWVGCAAGLLATTPFAPAAFGELADAPPEAIAGVAFLGVGPTAVAFLTWAYALSHSDAGALAATTLAVPALAIGISWLALGELPTALGLVGGALALLGVAITRRRTGP